MAELKQNIMRRVYVIYAFRMVVPKVAILTVALFALKYFVSFVDVFRNMPSLADISHSVLFFWSAFAHTDIVVQESLVATLAVLTFMARDLVRNAHMLSFAR
ncbi:MAG: hypothetical protein COV01_02035 [Candidatus Taylorbacteria bacterium CG10_big_fil_rev_8_21_14_0_10_41_48]|uniref:Uncharacterized protein n=1 Tax=Candidatus Taylorbacteria bacterium CG10_big_fil_rev_8_21_14_0_10_41_48 TaxID=1975024 RepID=A0A2M8LCA6_9BACT|nr:MAG: hypothetical protein COV01_02035 [Candidatus Taylorbacteria bacterium CG10_big_fil_rev_8_21_14_0_10_41_48]